MKILFLLTTDLESPAGGGRYFPLARALTQLGHSITIAALHANFGALDQTQFDKDGVEIRYMAPMHVLKRENQKFYYPAYKLIGITARATWALSRAALSIPADIVHIGKPHPMNGIAGLLARSAQRKVVFLDYDDYEAASGHFEAIWQKQIVTFFEDHIPRHVDYVTTHNSFLHQRLRAAKVPEARIIDLPNGVDFERFALRDPQRLEELRTELRLAGKKVVGFIGSLSFPSHPLELLLQAFQQVRQSLPDSVLLIVGGGEDLPRLVEKASKMGLEEAVRFCGRIPQDEVSIYYRLADVLVDPVYDDPAARGRLPLKLFESWASLVPFVSGDVGDRRAVLGSPPAGMLALPGNPASLSSVILQVFENPELANELRQRGLERGKLYTWERLAQRLEAIYEQAYAMKRSI
jgi:glycosyltransferase involved in cell wall biosynthesis